MDQVAEIAWAPLEATLRELYLEKDMSLAEIMLEMVTKYDFKATKSQYELQFKRWQFRKNRTAAEWQIVARKLAERENEHKKSVVVLNGRPIKPKKLRKETLRYGSASTTFQVQSPGPSPPTPEGFVIRTPSPMLITSMPILNAQPSIDIYSILPYGLPFYEFNSVFNHQENPFLCAPENSGLDLDVISKDDHSTVLRELVGKDGKRVSGSLSDTIKAVLPENIFPCVPTAVDMAISHRKQSSIQQFLKLSMYLASNNFFGSTTVASKKIYEWVKRRSNAGLMEYIFSIGGPTVEALTENLFRLALDAEDVRTINKMMKLGIDPNEQVYRTRWGICHSPLLQACYMQSLKLVRALIDGGAKIDNPVGNEQNECALEYALDCRDDDYELKPHLDPELVRILLNAGAVVNPSSGESPLVNAVDWGHVKVVDLLVSAGANVNIVVSIDDNYTSTPLMKAIKCEREIPDGDVISMVRTLLLAGADPQGVAIYEGDAETPLEAAMGRKNMELIRLLLDNGARVTEKSFVQAVRFCDMADVKLLLNSGGEVTEPVIECAVEHNSMLVGALLEITDNRIKKRCKTAAFIASIKCGDLARIRELAVSGSQLIPGPKLKAAIRQVITAGKTQVLSFLLDEHSEYRTVSLESLGTGLWTAICNGRHDIVELLLSSGANIDSGTETLDESPLLKAIAKKDSKLAKQLLDAGAKVNGKGEYSHAGHYNKVRYTVTVLPAVVDWGHYPLMQDIINAGAEVDALEKGGDRTALFIAVQKKDREAIKLLIDAGANVNASGSMITGQTALMAASQNNDLPTVRYLLELGADSDEWSLTFGIAGSVELVETLLEARLHRYKRYSKGYGCGALQHGIKLKETKMIKVLLAKGIDANAVFNRNIGDDVLMNSSKASREPYLQTGTSALGFAIESDKSDDYGIVRLLLQGGANPNSIVTDDRRTALLVAIGTGNFGLVKLLIAAGADANPKLGFGVARTPLQLAAEKGRIDIVHILLDNGADVNMPPFDRYGATALQFAAIGGYIGIVQLLIQKGADINAPSAKIGSRTALEGAAEHGRIDVLQLLLGSGALIFGTGVRQYDRARELAVENGHRAASRLLEKCNKETSENLLSWDEFMDFDFFGDLSV